MKPAPVALDTEERRHFNRLAARPPVRITLRLGEIESLFPDPPDSAEGRRARLQVLGLFYYPLRHPKAAERFPDCWKWVKDRIFKVASDAEADDAIQERLRERVVKLPLADSFAKIRVPGGYAYLSRFSQDSGDAPGYPFQFGAGLYEVEETYYKDNPVLGKLPILAKVESWSQEESAWKPMKSATVHFQLLAPVELPPYDETVSPVDQVTPPGEVRETAFSTFDPQSRNCPPESGGKRGVFQTTGDERFPFSPAAPVVPEGAKHAHAVRTVTDSEGDAGVLFLPSRMGGDAYRIRAYLPAEGDGTELDAVRADTGTMVVWRNIRISRLLQKEVERPVLQELLDQAKAAPYEITTEKDYLWEAGIVDGAGFSFDPREIQLRFARAYCEVEFDGELEAIPKEEYAKAYRHALEETQKVADALDKKFDLRALFYPPEAAASGNSVVHIPMRSPQKYNELLSQDYEPIELVGNEPTEDEKKRVTNLLRMGTWPGLLGGLSFQGALPGLTVVTGSWGATWQILYLLAGDGNFLGGLAQHYRGCYAWKGSPTRLFTHEAGHCLFREHAPGHDEGGEEARGVNPTEHDGEHPCVMSYRESASDFCVLCTLALRGWKIQQGKAEEPAVLRKETLRRLCFRLKIDSAAAEHHDDRFRLFSTDGTYEESKTIRDDKVAGDEFVDLVFEAPEELRYSLEVVSGREAKPYLLFEDVPYSDLERLSAQDRSIPS